jgi:hypothetical protein
MDEKELLNQDSARAGKLSHTRGLGVLWRGETKMRKVVLAGLCMALGSLFPVSEGMCGLKGIIPYVDSFTLEVTSQKEFDTWASKNDDSRAKIRCLIVKGAWFKDHMTKKLPEDQGPLALFSCVQTLEIKNADLQDMPSNFLKGLSGLVSLDLRKSTLKELPTEVLDHVERQGCILTLAD